MNLVDRSLAFARRRSFVYEVHCTFIGCGLMTGTHYLVFIDLSLYYRYVGTDYSFWINNNPCRTYCKFYKERIRIDAKWFYAKRSFCFHFQSFLCLEFNKRPLMSLCERMSPCELTRFGLESTVGPT